MKFSSLVFCFIVLFFIPGCNADSAHNKAHLLAATDTTEVNQSTDTSSFIISRFPTPKGFTRVKVAPNSFGAYLRMLPLKKKGAPVLYYNGGEKFNRNTYDAVVDLPIGNRDLHQCADAVMRLYGEYLFLNKRYSEICFNFLSDGKPRCYETFTNDRSYQSFWKYMEYVFSFANTSSLFDQMKPASIIDIKIGDAFIEKKSPYGHAVIVADMAVNAAGEKVFLLLQSYMPAQEIQVLKNGEDRNISPWYRVPSTTLKTPEWKFKTEHLRRF